MIGCIPAAARLAASCLLVLLALTLAAPAGAHGNAAKRLLKKYQPVLVFHPGEPFRPTMVRSFVADSELERFVGTSPAQLVDDSRWVVVDPDPRPGKLPAPSRGVVHRLDQAACRASAALAGRDCYAAGWREGRGRTTVYGRVTRTDTRIVLQYWLFYYDNPLLLPATPFGTFWQSHEGDWELVNVVLGLDGQPLEAAYSQHCSGQRKPWAAVGKSGGTHPIAYVALGSHANYFAPGAGPLGAIPIALDCIPASVRSVLPLLPFLQVVDQVLDGSSSGAVAGPPGTGGERARIRRIEGTSWSAFDGRWGESEYFFTPVALGPIPAGTAVPVGLAPVGPAHSARWNAQTVLNWPLAP